MYTRSSPEGILARELADEVADLRGSCGSPGAPAPSRFPRPVEAETALVPADQSVRVEDDERGKAPGPDPVQPNPEETLVSSGPESSVVPRRGHRKLLTQGHDLQMQEGAAAQQASTGKEQAGEEGFYLVDAIAPK